MGEILQPLDEDGLTIRKDPDSLSWLTEFVTYGQLVIDFPGAQGVVALSAL
jgi:hypothetical protein